MNAQRTTTMARLTHGTRVRHAGWGRTGTIRQSGDATEVRWDDRFGEGRVSLEGPVFPGDLEILGVTP